MSRRLVICDCAVADARGARGDLVDVVIEDGVIASVRPAVGKGRRGRGTRRLDGYGMTIVPGLINMHEHLGIVHPGTREEREVAGETATECLRRMAENAAKALRVGVTSMRLAGEPDGLDIVLRTWLVSRDVTAPRIWTAAQPLDYAGGGRGFVGAVECRSAEDYRRAAQEQVDRGADFLKIMLSGGIGGSEPGATVVAIDEYEAIRQVARPAGLRMAVHTAATPHPILDSMLKDGLDSFEHCYLMDADLLRRCVERLVLLVLTPLVGRSRPYLEQLEVPPDVVERMTLVGQQHWQRVRAAVEAGAHIALGTDLHSHVVLEGASAPVRELELYEEAGADPRMLLGIASRNGASWLGVGERLGLVEEGFEADLLVLGKSPFTAGARAFRDLRHVISRGRPIEARDLDWVSRVEVEGKARRQGSRPVS